MLDQTAILLASQAPFLKLGLWRTAIERNQTLLVWLAVLLCVLVIARVLERTLVRGRRTYDRRQIPSWVKQKVWNRDDGRCVICGSNEELEFDHEIPVSRGGANTVKNIRLLCKSCNRKKGAKIE